MEAHANFVANVLATYGSESPEFDSALCSLAAAAREKGLRGSAAVAVLVSAIRQGKANGCPAVSAAVAAVAVSERDSLPLG